jgi:hypothetical protein
MPTARAQLGSGNGGAKPDPATMYRVGVTMAMYINAMWPRGAREAAESHWEWRAVSCRAIQTMC